MKSNDSDASSRFQYFHRLQQHFLQCGQFIVHFNSQCLEHLGNVLVRISFHRDTHSLLEIVDGVKRRMLPDLNNCPGKCFCIRHFSIPLKQLVQLLFRVGIQHIISLSFLPPIHSHIHLCFKPGRKTTLCFIKLVTAYAKVCQDSFHCTNVVQSEKTLKVPEVVRNKDQAFII